MNRNMHMIIGFIKSQLVSHIEVTRIFSKFKWNLHIFDITLKLKCLYKLTSTYAPPRVKNSSHFLEEELFKGKILQNAKIDLDTCWSIPKKCMRTSLSQPFMHDKNDFSFPPWIEIRKGKLSDESYVNIIKLTKFIANSILFTPI